MSTTMRAAQIARFGDTSETLTVEAGVSRPTLPPGGDGDALLLEVHAVSLSPSDYRMSSGATDLVKKPATWPYIPGGDVAGVVVDVPQGETDFRVGDRVVGTWELFGEGGIAEFALVKKRLAVKMPERCSWVEGAAMADSPSNAMLAVEDAQVKEGDRVLVLGGSGAVGTVVIQFARNRGAAYIAATSTDEELVKRLGADVVVNYREKNWWELDEWKESPFDVVIDCAEGVKAWERVLQHGLLKGGREGGRFLAVVLNEWDIQMHSWLEMVRWFAPVIRRVWMSRLIPGRPRYIMMMPAPRGDSLPRCIKKIADGEVEVVVDKRSPFPFTTEGVREAFKIMVERGGHGKIVIQIRED